MRALLGVSLVVIGACADDMEADPPCRVDGNYVATGARIGGDCPESVQPGTATLLIRSSGGGFAISSPLIAGDCPAQLDRACHFTAACNILSSAGGESSRVVLDYTFTADGYIGSSYLQAFDGSGAPVCDVALAERGTRQ